MRYPFGKDFTHWFLPLDPDGLPLTVSAAVQTQTPAIHIFRDQPTVAQGAAGTGALQSIISWTWDSSRNGWSFSVNAIDDPNPGNAPTVETYWAAFNLFLDSGETVQTVLTTLELERVSAHTVPLDVDEDDLRGHFPQINSYSTEAQRLTYIQNAIDHIRSELKSRRFLWVRLHRPDQLKKLVCYRAVAMLCLVQYQGGNERFWKLYTEFTKFYDIELGGLEIPVDLDGDGKKDADVKPKDGTIMFMR